MDLVKVFNCAEITWFLRNDKALSKFRYQILCYLISIIKSYKNQSVKTNFILTMWAILNRKMTHHYNQIQRSARFALVFTFLSDFSFIHDSKVSLLYVLWVENILRSLKLKVAGKKFWATFYEFKVYIFLLKVLLYLLVIFIWRKWF